LFADAGPVSHNLRLARAMIDLLDQIDNDPTRRAAAIADIRARWP
jgi:hypothetical protein